MGVFYKNNRWYLDYYDNGERIREVVTIPQKDPATITQREAEAALNIRKAEIATGKFDITKKEKPIKFEKLVLAFLDWANNNHKAPERDHAACKSLLAYFEGKNIYGLNLWDVEKYKSARKKQGKMPETINKELGILRRMFNLSLQGALSVKVGKNPVQGIKLVKVPKLKPRTYKDWEFKALYVSAALHFRPILLCAYMTGMRRSEIVRLKWEDVNLEERTIYISESKNGESRTIPISEVLLDTLLKFKGKSQSRFVFTTAEGKPYTSVSAWKSAWSTALKKSGIEKGRFHDFRHTFCSDLIVNEKEDYVTVMELSGHKDIRMLKRYSHTKEEAKKAAIRKLDKHVNLETLDTYMDTKAGNDDQESINTVSINNLND